MKIRILIHRQTKKEPATGTLRAYVLQSFKTAEGESVDLRGPNLLAGVFKRIDSAIPVADAAVLKLFKLIEPPEIEYVIEDYLEESKPENTSGAPNPKPPAGSA